MKCVFKTLVATCTLSVLIITGCKKAETGPAGPAGPAGPQGNSGLIMTSGGTISGTLTGIRKDGTPFTEPFGYTYYGGNNSGRYDSLNATNYNFSFMRSTGDVFTSNYADFQVTTSSKAATTGTLNFDFSMEKPIGGNKMFSFWSSSNSTTATGLSFNSVTGLFSGNFSVNIPSFNNSTGNTATITGSFQVTLIQYVNITRNLTSIKIE